MTEKSGVHAKEKESKHNCSNLCNRKSGYNSSVSPADRILQLQRTAGNQAVQKLILSKKSEIKSRTRMLDNFSPECSEFHQCKLQDSLRHARQMVAYVLAELPPIAMGTVTKGRIIDLLNVHFHTKSADNVKKILDNFRLIESELNAPILYICDNDNLAFCNGYTGGFTDCGGPKKDVHLCAPYFVSLTCEQRARALVHEAAHHIRGFFCRDEVYLGEPEYSILPPEKAMRNPDTYAQFANMMFLRVLSCKDCAAEIQRRSRH